MRFKYLSTACILIAAISLLPGCSKEDNVRVRDNNILPSVVTDNFNLKTFSTALERTGLTKVVSQKGPFTLLVPSDVAFSKAGIDGPGGVIGTNSTLLENLTAYHILEGVYMLNELPFLFNQEITSYGGGKLYITRWIKEKDTILTVNGSRILPQSTTASNGLLQVIDKVLKPYRFAYLADAIAADNSLTLFYQALQRAGMEELLRKKGPYTVFAPTNAAMITYGYASLEAINKANPAALAALLRYHIVADRRFLNDYVLSSGTSATSTQAMIDDNTVKIKLIPNSGVQGGYEGITLQGSGNGNSQINIVQQDIITGNGVLHTIDQVLRITQ